MKKEVFEKIVDHVWESYFQGAHLLVQIASKLYFCHNSNEKAFVERMWTDKSIDLWLRVSKLNWFEILLNPIIYNFRHATEEYCKSILHLWWKAEKIETHDTNSLMWNIEQLFQEKWSTPPKLTSLRNIVGRYSMDDSSNETNRYYDKIHSYEAYKEDNEWFISMQYFFYFLPIIDDCEDSEDAKKLRKDVKKLSNTIRCQANAFWEVQKLSSEHYEKYRSLLLDDNASQNEITKHKLWLDYFKSHHDPKWVLDQVERDISQAWLILRWILRDFKGLS